MFQILSFNSSRTSSALDRPLSPADSRFGKESAFSSLRSSSKRAWTPDFSSSTFFIPAASTSFDEPAPTYSRIDTFKSGSLSLHLTNTVPRPAVPTFYPGERVEGKIVLELTKPMRCKRLSVRMEGCIATSRSASVYQGQGSTEWDKHSFLSTTLVMAHDGTSVDLDGEKSFGTSRFGRRKVQGRFEFPFEFGVPEKGRCNCPWEKVKKKAACSATSDGMTYPLPSSFVGRDSGGQIQYIGYRLVVELDRPERPWSISRRLFLPIVIHASRPRHRYHSNSLNSHGTFPPVPALEPEMWTVKRRILDMNHLKSKMGSIELRLALPNPVELFIGDRIPFMLSLASNRRNPTPTPVTLITGMSISLQRSMEYTVRVETFQDRRSVIQGTIYGHQSMRLESGGSKQVMGELDLRAWNVDGSKAMLSQAISTCNIDVSWEIRITLQLPSVWGGSQQCIDFPIQLFDKPDDSTIPNTYLDLSMYL
ncbi:hypothetical protein BT69DRAFT_1321231 [Atractiella rhizophila]|nr:hypothetical protein BT69DRAFT_1321231 [Atractiella rhizophila]